MCLFLSTLGWWQGAGLVGEERVPAAKFPQEVHQAGHGWPCGLENSWVWGGPLC